MSLLGGGNRNPPMGGPPVLRPPTPMQPTFGGNRPAAAPTATAGGQRPWWQDLLLGLGTSALGAGVTYGLGQIPGLGGQTVQGPQMPSDIVGLRGDVISWLRGQGQTPNAGGMQPYGSVNQQGGFGGMGQGPIYSGGQGAPTYTASGAMTGPISSGPLPVNRQYDTEVTQPGSAPGGLVSNRPLGVNPGNNGTVYAGPGLPPGMTGVNPASGGTAPGSPYGQIFSNYVGAFTPATTQAAQVGAPPQVQATNIGAPGQANFQSGAAGPAVGAGQYLDPRFSEIFNMIPGLGAGMAPMTASAAAVRPVSDVASVANMVQNLSQIVNSPAASGYFKDEVLSPYRALFGQQQADALAAAKEASGNLTGSGYANALGGALERLVPQQNVQLSDILTNLAGTELGRQQSIAQREQEKNFQNQNTDLARALEDARLQTQASITNAGEGNRFNISRLGTQSDLLGQFANIFGNQAGAQALAQNNINMFNTDQANQAGVQQAISNANQITQTAIAQGQITAREREQYFNAVLNQELNNAQFQQSANQFNAGAYNTTGMFNNQQQQNVNNLNAGQYLNLLLPMLTGGVGQGQQYYQPGVADSFAQMLPYFMQMFGSQSVNVNRPTSGQPTALNYTPTPFVWNSPRNG